MSAWQFSFPQSRTCLWDGTPTDSCSELYLMRNSWLRVHISSATLQLALRHAKQSHRKLFDCFLIASVWITEDEGITLEVDRFDPGRPSASGCGLSPTTLIPGDLPIPSQVAVNSHPDAKHLIHNLETLGQSIATVKQSLSSHTTPLDPALLLSLRLHCTCSEDGKMDVEAVCLYPGLVVEATPIKPIAIVQTALARNLNGPLSLSAIQGKTKHGYVTMDASRKLILLLNSDPKASQLPLVGIWVSGVSSVYHPAVWMACVKYTQSTTLTDRVWGEGGSFVTLVYLEGSTKPLYSECTLKNADKVVELASGENSLLTSSTAPLMTFELYPVQESTALHTLLETVEASGSERVHETKVSCDLVPLPSPQPTPMQVPTKLARDSELSMISCLSLCDEGSTSHSSPVTCKSYDLAEQSHDFSTQQDDKENTPVNQPRHDINGKTPTNQTSRKAEGTPTNQSLTSLSQHSPLNSVCESQPDSSLIVFPAKLGLTPRSADTQRLLKQQEMQLRALQKQVNTLLQAQTQSPVLSQSVNTTPKVEASTSTGESLYWPHPPPHCTTSQPHISTPSQAHSLPTHSTLSQPHNVVSTHSTPSQAHTNTESSVYSSMVSGLSMKTATSTLSQSVSDLHLDLQSYAQSPSPPQSPSFGDSASVVAEEGSPINTLHTDQQQIFQNLLSTVNALLSSQDNSSSEPNIQPETPSLVSTASSHCRNRTHSQPDPFPSTNEPEKETSQNSSHHYNLSHTNTSDPSFTMERESDSQTSLCSSHHYSTQEPHIRTLNDTTNRQQFSQIHSKVHSAESNKELPYLHPDVLQQCQGAEVSMFPVPRIVGPIVNSSTIYGGSTVDGLYRRSGLMGSSDCTLDENSQMADMIAMKYLGGKMPLEVDGQGTRHVLSQGTDSTIDSGSAHMSMATKQYLQRHHLLAGNGNHPPHNTLYKGDPSNQEPNDNILNIRRLKELPKLI